MKTLIQKNPLIYTIDDVFNDEYCQKLISQSEQRNYELATINIGTQDGQHKHETHVNVRNNDRVIFDDKNLATTLFDLIAPELPETWNVPLWELEDLNDRFRYYRYGQGQRFKPHFDGSYERSKFCHSFLTLLFYLNDDFKGGETKFYHYQSGYYDKEKPTHVIKPKKGQALIFDHMQLHEGSAVITGQKYVLRTDVMYRAVVM